MMSRISAAADAWLRRPPGPGPGNLGLFRIAYALFYLWHLSYVRAGLLAAAPAANWRPIWLYRVVLDRPPTWIPGVAEALLAGLLVLLLAGVRTRIVTGMVLVVGFLLDGFLQSLGKVEHGTVFLTFYLPLIMSFSTWGESWSIDSMRHRTSGATLRPGRRLDWREAWPVKAILLLLSFLFFTAGLSKLLGGYWISDPDTITNLVARAYYRSIEEGLTPNPFAGVILQSTVLTTGLRWGIPVFECLFVLVLIGPRIRSIYVSLALIFHAANAVLLAVTFTPVLVAYGIAVDWQGMAAGLRSRFRIRGRGKVHLPDPNRLSVYAFLLAGALTVDWNVSGVGRTAVSLGGLLDWLTIWYVVGPVAVFWAAASTFDAFRRGSRNTEGENPQPVH